MLSLRSVISHTRLAPRPGCSRWGQLSVTPDWLPGQADENPRQCSWLPLVLASCLLSFSLTFRVFSARWRSMCAASTQKRSTSVRSATRPSAVPTSCVCTCSGTRTARTSCAPRVGSSLRCEPAGHWNCHTEDESAHFEGVSPVLTAGAWAVLCVYVWFERDSRSVLSDSLWPHGL